LNVAATEMVVVVMIGGERETSAGLVAV